MNDKCTWQSYQLNVLTWLKKYRPESRIMLTAIPLTGKRITEVKFLKTAFNESVINLDNDSDDIATVKPYKLPVHIFAEQADYDDIDPYVKSVISDGENYETYVKNKIIEDNVSGSTPVIKGIAGYRYVCGECSTLSIVAPASGCIDVLFKSGSTATTLTVTSAKTNTTISWANGFDPSDLEANTTYELNIMDGEYGVSCSWM